MILIKNGRIVDPKTKRDDVLDIIIDNGKIKKIGKYQRNDDYERIIEAAGMIVAPGFVDAHVHFRDPGFTYKETIQSGAKAAAKGGYTSVIMMGNTKPPIDNVETLDYVISEGKKTDIHVYASANITKGMKGKELVNMQELKEHGAVCFTDDGLPLRDERLCYDAMLEAKKVDLPLSFHEEEPSLIGVHGINEGKVSEQLGIIGAPTVAEDVMVARDCMLSAYTGARIHIQHVSSGNSVQMIKMAKEMGAKVTAEVAPHHFSLTEEEVLKKGTLAKMNPPLRTKYDIFHVTRGIKGGIIDMIATDHSPHSEKEKQKELSEAPSGIIGLETALALAITKLIRKGHITMTKLIELMSYQPARVFGLDAGYLEEGGPADIVIFNEQEPWTVGEFESKSSNSPFIGEKLYGKVKYTICKGKVIFEDEAGGKA